MDVKVATASRCTEEQKERLVAFVEKNPKLVKGKFDSTHTAKESKKLWDTIAAELNAIPGPSKKGKDWKETWRRLRRTTKELQAKINVSARKTGGGPPCNKVLTPIQERISALLGKTLIEGHSHRESSIGGKQKSSKPSPQSSDSESDEPGDQSENELGILDKRSSPVMLPPSPLQSDTDSEGEPLTKKPSPPLPPLGTPGPSGQLGRKRMRAAEKRFVHAAAAADDLKEARQARLAQKARELDMLEKQNEKANELAAQQLEVQRSLVGAITSVGQAMARIATVVEFHYGLLAEESQENEGCELD